MNLKPSIICSIIAVCLLIGSCKKATEPESTTQPNTVVGFVIKASDGSGIAGAQVHIQSALSDTLLSSDVYGIFRIVGLHSGTYSVSTNKSGYANSTLSLTIGKELLDTLIVKLSPPASDIPTEGLAVDLSFGDTITDSKGTKFNFYGRKYPMEGRFDGDTSAILFESDNYMTFDMPLPFSHNFTACFWFNDFGVDVVNDPGLVLENNLHDYGMRVDIQKQRVFVDVKTDSILGEFLGSAIVRDGRWHFVAAQLRQITARQTEIKIFIDGVYMTPGAMDNPIADGDMTQFSNTFYVGGEGDAIHGSPVVWPLRGMLDGIRLYNRTLSQDELLKLYHEKGW